MTKVLIVVAWLVLLVWWLSPSVNSVKNKINEHNAQIEKALNEAN
jgi:predicted Holliday junction resolvase-like endonuclease